jgi:hypothetical protein
MSKAAASGRGGGITPHSIAAGTTTAEAVCGLSAIHAPIERILCGPNACTGP